MTDTAPNPNPAPYPPSGMTSDERQLAFIVYILLLIPVSMGTTHIVGLVIAYVQRDSAPDWLKSHYTYQIRSFWLGLAYLVAACVSVVVLIGFILVPVVVIWYIVRCAIGLSRLSAREPIANPQTWTI